MSIQPDRHSELENEIARERQSQRDPDRVCTKCGNSAIRRTDQFCSVCGEEVTGNARTLWNLVSSMWSGRLNRRGTIVNNLILYLATLIYTPLSLAESTPWFAIFWVLFGITMVLQVGVMISRVHDIGIPGWLMIPWLLASFALGWYGTAFVIVISFVIMIPYVIWPGNEGVNSWGAPSIGFIRYWKRILGQH